jgi:hypothetical protein
MVNPFKRKHFIPLFGFLPSEIRFQNGNGNGNGDLSGADFGMDIGGGFTMDVSTGEISLSAEAGQSEVSSEITGMSEASPAFNIEMQGYTPPPESSYTPSASPDLSEIFSPSEPTWPSETRFVEAWEHPVAPYSEATAKTVGLLFNEAARFVFNYIPFGGYIKRGFDALFGEPLGAIIEKGLTGARMTRGEMAMSEFISPEPQISTEGNLESVLSLSVPQKEPSSYPSTSYVKAGYPSLSTSLFSVTERVSPKESSGGLMIFPTSTAGIEKEGSSLLKKQEPVIDSTSMLFLLGMGVVGMVLRKGARA